MAKGSFFKRVAAVTMAVALSVCFPLAAVAEPSEYADIDKLYSRKGDESIYISEGKFLYNFKGEIPGVTICGYVGDSSELKIPNMINGREVSPNSARHSSAP